MAERHGLGRGLSALFGDDAADEAAADSPAGAAAKSFRTLPIEHLQPGRYQPRQRMDEAAIEELAQSIRQNGIFQPILVRKIAGEGEAYEIIAGERRWRAAQRARLHEVPVLVKELSDSAALEIALVENLQREGLTALEEAEGFRRLMDEFSHSQEVLAKALGKSRSHIANTLRLLNLPAAVRALLADGRLSAGHGRALLAAPNPEELAIIVVRQGLNVRQTERLAQQGKRGDTPGRATVKKTTRAKDTDTIRLERDLSARLGLAVDLRFEGEGGTLTLRYQTLEQLDDVLRRLATDPPPAGNTD